jgi:hypothetical protein
VGYKQHAPASVLGCFNNTCICIAAPLSPHVLRHDISLHLQPCCRRCRRCFGHLETAASPHVVCFRLLWPQTKKQHTGWAEWAGSGAELGSLSLCEGLPKPLAALRRACPNPWLHFEGPAQTLGCPYRVRWYQFTRCRFTGSAPGVGGQATRS